MLLAALLLLQTVAPAQQVPPVLEFPEAGLDDPAAYEGYRTRFHRDAHGNAFQVYLDRRSGRVVNLWANAANESAGFTVRDEAGEPAPLEWGSPGAAVREAGREHSVEYALTAGRGPVRIGRFQLGSMRVERDFQHFRGHLEPFGAPGYEQRELTELLGSLERLPAAERRRHLALLDAASTEAVRARLRPAVSVARSGADWVARVEQPSLDGRNRMALEFRIPAAEAEVEVAGGAIAIRPRGERPVRFSVRASTDAAALTPLSRAEIFHPEFLAWVERERAEHDRIARTPEGSRGGADGERLRAFRRLDRQLRSMELMSYREKLMAGLPNYATYFGRDMQMTALMMQPVWTEGMLEHVIAGVLRKLAPTGEVSHEEALGGQAVRENAAAYHRAVEAYLAGGPGADTALARARALLADLQATRESHHVMMDDDFQFPLLVARYLADPQVSAERKRRFLAEPARPGGESRLASLLRNLGYVAEAAAPYARDPVAANLVPFKRREDDLGWFPGSWRDSGVGYAGGRYAMDINVVWVPQALAATERILAALRELGHSAAELEAATPQIRGTPLAAHLRDPAGLRAALGAWRETARHFWVTLPPAEARERVRARLAALPAEERAYWEGVLDARPLEGEPLEFLALSLDDGGRPIPVVNTDPATHLFLEDLAGRPAEALRELRGLLLPYPVGLLVPQLGPLVANDAYAAPAVWEAFERDRYHSPRVVWGREVNLLLLGLARQIRAATDPAGRPREAALAPYVAELRQALRRTLEAVEASGLKHNELWSYRIQDGRLLPVRYPISTDLQLWNLTDLAVQYELARLPDPGAPR